MEEKMVQTNVAEKGILDDFVWGDVHMLSGV